MFNAQWAKERGRVISQRAIAFTSLIGLERMSRNRLWPLAELDQRQFDRGCVLVVAGDGNGRHALGRNTSKRVLVGAGDGDPQAVTLSDKNRSRLQPELQFGDLARHQRHGVLPQKRMIRYQYLARRLAGRDLSMQRAELAFGEI